MPPHSRRPCTVGFVGNCQAELLQRAFAAALPAEEFATFYLFFDPSPAARAQAVAELARSDIVLLQDIQGTEGEGLSGAIRAGTRTVRFPFLRFASPWPYDDFNGLRDTAARRQDDPALHTTTYYDGILGRLRRLVPDPTARFDAYKARAVPGIVDPARVHDFERRRLEALDRRFDIGIGRFILDGFRRTSLFHTVNRPCGALLAIVLADIFARLDLGGAVPQAATLDELGAIQVPVHPGVAESLSIEWATEQRLYRHGGVEVTWEQFVRGYISRYG